MKFTDEQIGDILAWAQEGKSVSAIAKELGCSHRAIENVLNGKALTKRLKETRNEMIVEEYQRGIKDIDVLADTFDCSPSTIRNLLAQAGIYKSREKKRTMLSPEEERAFLDDFYAGKPILQCAFASECTRACIDTLLKRHSLRNHPTSKKWTLEEQAENILFLEAYKNGASFSELLEQYGRARSPMITVLKRAGIDFEYQQKVRKREYLYQQMRNRYLEKKEDLLQVNRRYEIHCENQEEAKDLSDEIWKKIENHPFEKNLRFLVVNAVLIIEGEVTEYFHQMMIDRYIEED